MTDGTKLIKIKNKEDDKFKLSLTKNIKLNSSTLNKFNNVKLNELKEIKNKLKLNNNNLKHKSLDKNNENLRRTSIDWINNLCKIFKFENSTFFSFVDTLDRVIKIFNFDFNIDDLHIVSVTSLNLVIKMDEVNILKLETIKKKILHNKFETKDIVSTEILLLKKLNFKILQNSFCDFTLLIIDLIFSNEEDIENNKNKFNLINNNKNNLKEEIFNFSVFIYKLCCFNSKLTTKYKKFDFYFSIFYFSLAVLEKQKLEKLNFLLNIFKIQLNDVSKLVDKIKRHVSSFDCSNLLIEKEFKDYVNKLSICL